MKIAIPLLLILASSCSTSAQKPEETEDWSRRPDVVVPGRNGAAPNDAIILYGGKEDISKWSHVDGSDVKWAASEILTIKPKSGSIKTRQAFGDCQLHVEWRSPEEVKGESQGRGNSGIFLMGLYEVQVLDSYENETYYNGQAGSIYKQHIPLVNASLPPGEWQTYDIFFTAPRFNEDQSLKTPAFVTVVHNGVLIQNHVEIKGPTVFIGIPQYKFHEEKLPLMLQNHTNPVSFRNIWIREL